MQELNRRAAGVGEVWLVRHRLAGSPTRGRHCRAP
jgi:hypothetical protein